MKCLVLSIVVAMSLIVSGAILYNGLPDRKNKNVSTEIVPDTDNVLGETSSQVEEENQEVKSGVEQDNLQSVDAQTNSDPTPSQSIVSAEEQQIVFECDESLLASWQSLFESKKQLYEINIKAEETRSKQRLDEAIGRLTDRGTGIASGGLAEQARIDEKLLHDVNIAEIENSYRAALFSLEASYPENC